MDVDAQLEPSQDLASMPAGPPNTKERCIKRLSFYISGDSMDNMYEILEEYLKNDNPKLLQRLMDLESLLEENREPTAAELGIMLNIAMTISRSLLKFLRIKIEEEHDD